MPNEGAADVHPLPLRPPAAVIKNAPDGSAPAPVSATTHATNAWPYLDDLALRARSEARGAARASPGLVHRFGGASALGCGAAGTPGGRRRPTNTTATMAGANT
ncbi:MAG: hypothetical protein GX886_12415, partial [Comamonadaceae bacterium]|nr:hypothetical protein [Comamonadaceae bacterium]